MKRLRDPLKKKGDWYLTTQYDSEDEDEDVRQAAHRQKESDQANGKRKRDAAPAEEEAYATDSVASSSSTASSSSSSPIEVSLPVYDPEINSLSAHYRPPPLDPLLPSPTHALADDFPLQPALMGNLVLQQTNLWLGNCQEGKSSGLHHDFHDNLYALVSWGTIEALTTSLAASLADTPLTVFTLPALWAQAVRSLPASISRLSTSQRYC